MIDTLLRAGANPKAANEFGATALYAAAANADPAVTVKLLAAGADPNAALASGETPLMEAARRGNIATVNALLAGKANPNAQEGKGGQKRPDVGNIGTPRRGRRHAGAERRRHRRPFRRRASAH